MPQIIKPDSEQHWLELRAADITSTDVATLFGCSPYDTLFQLWHRKRDKVVADFQESERSKWGLRLQDSIARGIAEDTGLKVARLDDYYRIPELRAGSSFDFSVIDEKNDTGILEVKNVDSLIARENWIVDGDTVEAPPHIELQLQHQLLVSGFSYGIIGALVGGNRSILTRREAAESVHVKIKNKISDFWASIEDNHEPSPDWSRDAKFIHDLYKYANAKEVLTIDENDHPLSALANDYSVIGSTIKGLESERAALKAQMLQMIGTASKVVAPGFSISSGIVEAGTVETYERPEYRLFRVTQKKGKK